LERLPKADRLSTAAAASAHDLNDELTIVLIGIGEALLRMDANAPARVWLLAAQNAAYRCGWKVEGLLRYSLAQGGKSGAATFEQLVALGEGSPE
jgi:hypothetical protein